MKIPKSIKKVGFDFYWHNKKVWNLEIPVVEISINKLIWHLDTPFFWHGKGKFNLTSNEIINNPKKYKKEYERVMNSDLNYPIDIMYNKGRWEILDGLHRLTKARILGMKKIKVRKIPRAKIKDILKD